MNDDGESGGSEESEYSNIASASNTAESEYSNITPCPAPLIRLVKSQHQQIKFAGKSRVETLSRGQRRVREGCSESYWGQAGSPRIEDISPQVSEEGLLDRTDSTGGSNNTNSSNSSSKSSSRLAKEPSDLPASLQPLGVGSVGEELTSGDRWRREAWEFIKGECFAGSGGIRADTVTVWLRTLLEQNSKLVETVSRLKECRGEEQADRRAANKGEQEEEAALAEKEEEEGRRSKSRRIEGRKREEKRRIFDSPLLETMDRIRGESMTELDIKCVETSQWIGSQRRNSRIRTSSRQVESEVDEVMEDPATRLEQLEIQNGELKEYASHLEEDNRLLREFSDNLKSDVDCLIQLSSRARDTGEWDPEGLNFCVVTFEEVFGPSKESPRDDVKKRSSVSEKPPGKEVLPPEIFPKEVSPLEDKQPGNTRHSSSTSYDSRLSLASDLMALERSPLRTMSRKEYCQVKDLRREIISLQEKCSQRVREGVEKDRAITELQIHITELNREMDDLKEENNANLSVINKLKDDLHEAKSRLHNSSTDISLLQPGSVTSLPEIPAYTSKFAKTLIRRNSQNILLQKLTEQVEAVSREKLALESEKEDTAFRIEAIEAERRAAEEALNSTRKELEDLILEHEKLKEDFRTLVRLQDLETSLKYNLKSVSDPNISLLTTDLVSKEGVASKKNILKQELNNMISVLGEKQEEMERVTGHLDSLRTELAERTKELIRLSHENEILRDTVQEQNNIILRFQKTSSKISIQ